MFGLTIRSIMLQKRNNHCIHQLISYYTAVYNVYIRFSLLFFHRCCSSIWCECLYFLQCYWICLFKLTVGGIPTSDNTQLAMQLSDFSYVWIAIYVANFKMVYLYNQAYLYIRNSSIAFNQIISYSMLGSMNMNIFKYYKFSFYFNMFLTCMENRRFYICIHM